VGIPGSKANPDLVHASKVGPGLGFLQKNCPNGTTFNLA
jgi:hypothetical protein